MFSHTPKSVNQRHIHKYSCSIWTQDAKKVTKLLRHWLSKKAMLFHHRWIVGKLLVTSVKSTKVRVEEFPNLQLNRPGTFCDVPDPAALTDIMKAVKCLFVRDQMNSLSLFLAKWRSCCKASFEPEAGRRKMTFFYSLHLQNCWCEPTCVLVCSSNPGTENLNGQPTVVMSCH